MSSLSTRQPRTILGVERLEQRLVPATFQVQNLNNQGAGSLRQALLDANAAPGADVVQFAVTGTIHLTSELPAISDPVNIDGSTAPGFAGKPLVEVDYDGTLGLRFTSGAADSTLRSLALVDALGAGVVLEGRNITVAGNYIGLHANGLVPGGNSGNGLEIRSNGNTIGSSAAADRNVISANYGAGIALVGAARNTISGNYIGTDAGGTIALGNRGDGILVTQQSQRNTIGGTALAATSGSIPIEGNLISGNDGNGVLLNRRSQFNTLSGNFIGTKINGTEVLGNQGDGVRITRADYNSLIGTYRDLPPFVFYNVLGGNQGNGLRIENSDNTLVHANYFGLGSDDGTVVRNRLNGVLVEGDSAHTTFGGVIPLGNVTAGNGLNGIEVRDRASDFLSFNTFSGVGSFSLNDTLGNGLDGILITSSGKGIVVRTSVISGNKDDGIEVSGNARGVQIVQSLIGTNTNGSSIISNSDNGIEVGGRARDTVIGGPQRFYSVAPHNVISGNLGNGVAVFEQARNTRINFSVIGTDAHAEIALSNSKAGIFLGPGVTSTIIGSRVPAHFTVVSGNGGNGIEMRGGSGNTVIGSIIGLGKDASTPIPNGDNGVLIVSGNRNVIGTSKFLEGNIIASNFGDGVRVNFGQRNSIQGNSIYDNELLGIALSPGANGNRLPPTLISAVPFTGNQIRIRGTVGGPADSVITLNFFVNFNNNGGLLTPPEGRVFIGTLKVRTNAVGRASFLFTANNPPPGAQLYTATATDAHGNTSPFSQGIMTAGS